MVDGYLFGEGELIGVWGHLASEGGEGDAGEDEDFLAERPVLCIVVSILICAARCRWTYQRIFGVIGRFWYKDDVFVAILGSFLSVAEISCGFFGCCACLTSLPEGSRHLAALDDAL